MTERSLRDWLSYLEQLHPQAIDMGLERVSQVAQRLGLRRPALQVVTVTGTNGKGTTCAVLVALLRAQGLRVGLYTSPHLRHYTERIQINGEAINTAWLCQCFAEIEQVRGAISLTYFEFGTLAALLAFQQSALDVAILEVGLGGRLDAVNIVDCDVAVVTSIDLDHSDWLGQNREQVAQEKSGIFRRGIPVVCGDAHPPVSLLAAAEALNAPLWIQDRDFGACFEASDDQHWRWWGHTDQKVSVVCESLLVPQVPLPNVATALQVMVLLRPDQLWITGTLPQRLQAVQVVGRLDRRCLVFQGTSVHLMLDVGHNPHAARYLARYIAEHPCSGLGRWRAVFGLLADKELAGVLEPLVPYIADWAVVNLATPRARSAASLKVALEAFGVLPEHVVCYEDVAQALAAQVLQAASEDVLLVFGSFYCVADALAWLENQGEGCRDVAG